MEEAYRFYQNDQTAKAIKTLLRNLKRHEKDCRLNPVCIPIWKTLADFMLELNRVEEADKFEAMIHEVVTNHTGKKTDELVLQGLYRVVVKLLNQKLYNDAYVLMKATWREDLSVIGQAKIGQHLAETLICIGEDEAALKILKDIYETLETFQYYGSFQDQLKVARRLIKLYRWMGKGKAQKKILKALNKEINIKWTASWNPLQIQHSNSEAVTFQKSEISGIDAFSERLAKDKEAMLAELEVMKQRGPASPELSCFEDNGDVSDYPIEYCKATNTTTPVSCGVKNEPEGGWVLEGMGFKTLAPDTHIRPHSGVEQYLRVFYALEAKATDDDPIAGCLRFVTEDGSEAVDEGGVFAMDDAHWKEVFCECKDGCILVDSHWQKFPEAKKKKKKGKKKTEL